MPIRRLLAETDSRELSRWLAYDNVYGLPDPHYGWAAIVSAICNVMGGAKTEPSDFLPGRRVERSAAADHAQAMAWAQGLQKKFGAKP